MQQFEPFYLCDGVSIDTRTITPNVLFVCIKGTNFDGNTFAAEALVKGARHVIVDNPVYYTDPERMTLVADSLKYLQELANYHRNKFDIPVIGITGSNGKTSTKELIHAVLKKKYKVLATEGNLNNHLGVPLTLLKLTSAHEIAVIEMGANKHGDIKELCDIAEPNYGIITNIGKAHLEGFIDFEGVLKTKRELYDSIAQNKGSICINADDPVLTANCPSGVATFSYGTADSAFVSGKLISMSPFILMNWRHKDYVSPQIETRMIGNYNFYNFLAAIAFGIQFSVDPALINDAIRTYEPTNRRSQVVKTKRNTLIMDCYNANPTSMQSAIESFKAMQSESEKIMILGEMKELGADSDSEHNALVKQVEESEIPAVVIGSNFNGIVSPMIVGRYASTEEFIAHLQLQPLVNKLILLKGSRSVGLERIEPLL